MKLLSITDVENIAKHLASSGYFKECSALSQAVTKILIGQELGLSPTVAAMNINVLDGKLSLSAGLISSLIQNSQRFRYKILVSDNTRCEILFQEKEGDQWTDMSPVASFTLEEAKQADLMGRSNWKKYTKAMMFNRCLTAGARMHTPALFNGSVYVPEELSTESVPVTNGHQPKLDQQQQEPQINVEAAVRELPDQSVMLQLSVLSKSLAITNAERKALQDAAAMYNSEQANKALKALTELIADRVKGNPTAGQREYLESLLTDISINERSEILKSFDVACSSFDAANKFIATVKKELSKRKAA